MRDSVGSTIRNNTNADADDKEVQEFLNNSVAFKTKIESIQKGEIDLQLLMATKYKLCLFMPFLFLKT